MEAGRHVECRAVGITAKAERRMNVFICLNAAEQQTQQNRRPQALLQPFTIAMDQAVVCPCNRGAGAQQDHGVEQRQGEGVHDRLDCLGWPLTVDYLAERAGEQREVEPAPEPAHEKHHFRSDEQDHAVT